MGKGFISKTMLLGAPQLCLEERHGEDGRQEGQKTTKRQEDGRGLLAGVGRIKGADEEAGKWRGTRGEAGVLAVGKLPLVHPAALAMGTMSQAASEAPLWAGLD